MFSWLKRILWFRKRGAIGFARKIVQIYDRVHEELDEGKEWKDIDNGLRKDDGEMPWSYDRWQGYMQQSMINWLREITRED